ncbi:NADPH-dependent FMN reductase [Halobacillus amylolyticus]|uniref:NADPH-dependent FMN reductase n=1 Tax=Halobacillus amylolyticus TaxID=2932259 RepID=A0ABY4HGJ4_9BACI|nr:NADPH-dependent FMN reductase [Halobacillus amylolyticus]UOR13497.1 NADPH-dependent FMN reductase [Halobacillus amylolyticus]
MSEIVLLSGSPSEESRSELVLNYLAQLVDQEGLSTEKISVRNVSPEDLFYARYDSEAIEEIATTIQQAKGVIVASPVYKASYSGILKALIDLLPQDVLKDTPVFPIMTGGSKSHLLAIEYALKPLLATLKGQNLKGVYLLDHQIDKSNPVQPITNEDCDQRLKKQLVYFLQVIKNQVPIAF